MDNKINVDLTPNPLALPTLHCSQGDTERRTFQFVLHRNGEIIDTSGISDPVFTSFPVYVGGTEELQPVNEASPSTSPIVADITYPDGLREGEEFTYRESPTTINGNARVSLIKGNTLVWNQLAHEMTSSHYGVTYSGDVVSFNDGVVSMTASRQYGGFGTVTNSRFSVVSGHKYLISLSFKPTTANTLFRYNYTLSGSRINANLYTNVAGVWNQSSVILTCGATGTATLSFQDARTSGWDEIQVKNLQIFDLTVMGLDSITDPSEFTSLFPLSYYDYNAGSLLSFNGTGIKTTGKNLYQFSETVNNVVIAPIVKGRTYTFSIKNRGNFGINLRKNYVSGAVVAYIPDGTDQFKSVTFTADDNFNLFLNGYGTGGFTYANSAYDSQLEFGSSATSYEPYTENTTNLPTLTYFPTGMKSAGSSVYDELTPSKAITRVGSVDLGTLNWMYDSSVPRFYSTDINSLVKKPANNDAEANAVSVYMNTTFNRLYTSEKKNMTMAFGSTGTLSIINTSYSDATAFKTAMSGVYLYYELATPTEETFTSAMLITKNGEASLYRNGDVLECECNEDISKESGYFDAKIALTDDTGTNYSNKFQIIVERSPE